MPVLYTNNAVSAISASITSAATSFSVTAGHGAKFPTISGSDYFYVTLYNSAGDIEIVKVTGRSTDTFTVVRAQDGTTALAFSAADKVELRITKAVLDDIKTDTKSSLTSSNVTTALGFTPYNASNPSGYITSSGNAATATTATTANALNTENSYTVNGLTSSGSGYFRKNQTDGNYTTAALWAESYGNTTTGVAFHISGVVGKFLEMRTNGTLYWNGDIILHSGNYNNYAPTLTGTGASGTWGINITGNAATATAATSATTATNANAVNNLTVPQLFNNMGGNHPSTTDFNAVANFGFTYLQSGTNGPGISGATQYYGVGIGLGNDYAFSAYASQLYWPRTPTGGNPYISVRFRESGSWGSWSKIYAGYADSVPWSGISGKPSGVMYYQGFTLDANTMDPNSTGFTYAANAPYTGPIIRISTGGGYDLWFNAPYITGGTLAFRTRNGDTNSLNAWRIILTSDNYNSYAPTLTGTGASGTWGINITGSAGSAGSATTATKLNSQGNYDATAVGNTRGPTGLNMFEVYTNNYPISYGNVLHIGGGGAGQLLIGWSGTDGAHAANYVRSKRDNDSGAWSPWALLLTDANYNSYAPTLTGAGASGTWGINVTGNAGGLSSTLGVGSGGSGATTLTGILKGNGTSAFTAATAGSDYVAPGTATTFTSPQTFIGNINGFAFKTSNIAEIGLVSATAASGTINYDITSQSVIYYTSNASAHWTLNLRASSGTTLNSIMSTGDAVTVVFLATQGSTAYYNSAVQVDGASVTPKWQEGIAPSSGNANSIDVYTYTVIKTGSGAFTVLASITKFA